VAGESLSFVEATEGAELAAEQLGRRR
jgi:hypothetical protein